MSTMPKGYSVATALEVMTVCTLAGASMQEARAYIAAGLPIEEVRRQLLEKRAQADEAIEINPRHATKSGAPDPWRSVIDSVNNAK